MRVYARSYRGGKISRRTVEDSIETRARERASSLPSLAARSLGVLICQITTKTDDGAQRDLRNSPVGRIRERIRSVIAFACTERARHRDHGDLVTVGRRNLACRSGRAERAKKTHVRLCSKKIHVPYRIVNISGRRVSRVAEPWFCTAATHRRCV